MTAKPVATTSERRSGNGKLHPRNRHQGRYDFAKLTSAEPSLLAFIEEHSNGETSIDFANPQAVRALNRALLKHAYNIAAWDIPPDNLCPPIPGRADYLHYLADLLAGSNGGKIPTGSAVQVLDIGVGANCIYPLIGHAEYQWQFVGTDISSASLTHAQSILDANPGLTAAIHLRQQTSKNAIFKEVVADHEWYDLTMCNPPFHSSAKEAAEGTQRKWRNLGKEDDGRNSTLNFGGQDAELWCPGGEAAFIQRMIKESKQMPTRCFWFTTLVSKSANLPSLHAALKQAGVHDSKTISMNQGQKQSRFLAWTFLNPAQQNAWHKLRWSRAAI
ncbi:23S rRNA (adenine(1618)-N(6))-methyltransferase RlmF [Undibacterium sp. Jales W-56]|uniref:23S rRNA (adenine(1618)-N(6))-methyltransferase RlmF n=1 Tax=Undibacterium sp. Jales W-56 TaxID=2897325 RepID=UPI0021D397C2|nr:23S rRNA (adenine(1618)-N(6))-methyltransferase RlmF [Undibacterium sp. Jales W-56]MCU6432574.1 23S rRNA (adenine(1618)-N(6))-methyltransferase RlmF [Undibacterium sp. Jales W-56]